jgi:hypothetical protein
MSNQFLLKVSEPPILRFRMCFLKVVKDAGLRRDPRMVERKKTGRAKARKRVRRLLLVSIDLSNMFCNLVYLGQTLETAHFHSVEFVPLSDGVVHHIAWTTPVIAMNILSHMSIIISA